MFGDSTAGHAAAVRAGRAAGSIPCEHRGRGEALARAERPLIVIGSQALLGGERSRRVSPCGGAAGYSRLPLGHGTRLLGPQHPLQMRHTRREAL